MIFDYDAKAGQLTERQTISTLPPGFAGSNFCSEILVSNGGQFVYAGNRLRDGIGIFSVGTDGKLTSPAKNGPTATIAAASTSIHGQVSLFVQHGPTTSLRSEWMGQRQTQFLGYTSGGQSFRRGIRRFGEVAVRRLQLPIGTTSVRGCQTSIRCQPPWKNRQVSSAARTVTSMIAAYQAPTTPRPRPVIV